MIPTPKPRFFAALLASWVIAAFAVHAESVEEAIARGDAAWERRAEGAREGRAAKMPIDAAVAAYEAALVLAPESLEARWKLMRALYFEGDYNADGREARRVIFDHGRQVGEAVFDHLAEQVGGREAFDQLTPETARERFGATPEVARVYFWSAVHWGLWGEAFGKIAAARQGVVGKLRDFSAIVIALDPRYEDAGGHRILGRLHSEAPQIPFITGWVSRETAIAELRRAVELAPSEPFNVFYLAEALLDHGPPASRAEALALLRRLAALEPRPEKRLEDERIRREARTRLSREGD